MQMIDPLSWVMSGVCDSSPLTNYDAHCSQSPRATLHTTPPLGRKRAMQIDDILSCRVEILLWGLGRFATWLADY
jgi:hypothetical protein